MPLRLLIILSLLAVVSGRADSITTYELPKPILKLSAPYALPASVLGGPFQLEARLTLPKLDSSAASVRLGDRLNFGFDGRHHTLFVEGPLVGKVTLLDPTAKHLSPGQPFTFKVQRNKDDKLTISINGKTVYQTNKLTGPLDHITLRPSRTTFDLQSLRLAGAIALFKSGLTLHRTTIPVLTDGEPHALLDLHLILEKPRTLTTACIHLGTNIIPADLRDLHLRLGKDTEFASTDRCARNFTLQGSLQLPAGHHHLQLLASIRKNTDLLHTLNPTCTWLAFADGGKIDAQPNSLPSLRLAHRIHKRGDHNCHTNRIPALNRAKDGSLLAVYDMRYNSSRDLQEHIDIGLSRSTDGGQTWAPPVPIMDMGEFGGKPEKENGCSDPNILVDHKTGEIFVTAVWTHGKPNTHQWRGNGSEPGHDIHKSSQFMMVRSNDHGLTWSKPENLTTKLKDPAWYLFAPAPGNGITLHDGTLVIPSQGRDKKGLPFSNLMWSKDHGKTWTLSNHARTDTTESSVAQLPDRSLLLNMRDNRNRKDKSDTNGRALSTTTNLGTTWSTHPADHSALPEPVCMASMISHTLPDGRHILFFSNPHNKNGRRDMTIQTSFDNGNTWPTKHHLLLDSGSGYGYSSLTIVDDHTLGILYESSQADMIFQKIPLADLVK